MIDELDDTIGSIWQIFYYMKKKINVDDAKKQDFIDHQTREMTSTFSPPSGLSSDEYSSLFMNHFLKARDESRKLLDDSSILKVRYSSMFQVGNKECLDYMAKLESDDNFAGWENPSIVEYFKKNV